MKQTGLEKTKEVSVRHEKWQRPLFFLLCFLGYAEFLQKVRRFRNHTEKHSLERGTLQWSKITGP